MGKFASGESGEDLVILLWWCNQLVIGENSACMGNSMGWILLSGIGINQMDNRKMKAARKL